MKKIIAIIAALMLSLSLTVMLTACGGGGEQIGDEFLGLEDGEEFTTDEVVKLSFIRPKGNDEQEAWWSSSIAAFNAAYSGRIELTETTRPRGDKNEYEQSIKLMVEDGLPDLLYVDGPYVSYYAYSNILIPIDNYIKKSYTEDFLSYIIDQGTYNERLYTLSIVDSTVMVFYRKSIMKEAGITIPSGIDEAWTWQELKEIALNKKIKKTVQVNGSSKTRYGLTIAGDQGEWNSYAFSPMWNSGVLDATGLVSTGYLNSQAGINAGSYLKSLVTDGAISPSSSVTNFYVGDCLAAMALTGTQNISKFLKEEGAKDDWGATYYPRNEEGGKYEVPCGGWTLGMTKDCKKEKRIAACEFIKFITSKDSCRSFAEQTTSPPARKSLFDEMEIYQTDENFKRMKEQILAAATPRVKTVGYAEFSPLFATAIKEIINTKSTNVKTKLDGTAATVDKKLKIYAAQ